MTDYETGEIRRECVRGCMTPRRHATDCFDNELCEGCLPRRASNGLLCFGCHTRLLNLMQAIPGQHRLLLINATPSGEQRLNQETVARIGDGWRTDSDQRHQGPYARTANIASEGGEPVRTACLDSAEALSDWLAETIERLCEDYQMRGPARAQRTSDVADGGRVAWRSAEAGWPAVTTYGHGVDQQTGLYVWVDPPAKFEVHSGTQWLLAQLERLEWDDAIGDVMEQFADLMSQCHSLAPWREQVAALKGIPCKRCQRTSLARFGGDENVTCLNRKCRETYTPGQYAIWVRVLNEERASHAASVPGVTMGG